MKNRFFSTDTKESFYWSGFIAADGCVGTLRSHGGKYQYPYLSIHLSISDSEHLEKFKKAIGCIANVSRYKKECKITITSRDIVEDLERFNIVPRKTKIYKFPDCVRGSELIGHYMRGYFDGDGCFSEQLMKNANVAQRRFSIMGTEQFLKIYQQVLIKKCNIKTNRKILAAKGTYSLQYGGNNIIKNIVEFLYRGSDCNIRLNRKYDKIFDIF